MTPPHTLARAGIALAAIALALPAPVAAAQAEPDASGTASDTASCTASALDASTLNLSLTTSSGAAATSYHGGQSYLANLIGPVEPSCVGDHLDITVPPAFDVTGDRSYPIQSIDGSARVATMDVTTVGDVTTARVTFNQTGVDMAATGELTLRAYLAVSLDNTVTPGQVVQTDWDVNGVRTPISVNVTRCENCDALPTSLDTWLYSDAGNQAGADTLRIHAVSQQPAVGQAGATSPTTSTFTMTDTLEAGSGQRHDCGTPLHWSWYTSRDQNGNPSDLTSGTVGTDESEVMNVTETSCSDTVRSYTATVTTPAGDDGTYTPVATRVRLPIVIDDLNGSYSATLTGGQDGTALPSRRASVRASNGGGRLISDAVSIDAKDADGHDADTAADAADLTSANGAARLVLTVRNTGEEQLQNVRIDDSVDTGDATVSNLTCAFPDGTTGTVWSGPFEVGGEFTCTADLSGVTAGSEHADTATVTANGVTSGNEVSGLNGYHARVTG